MLQEDIDRQKELDSIERDQVFSQTPVGQLARQLKRYEVPTGHRDIIVNNMKKIADCDAGYDVVSRDTRRGRYTDTQVRKMSLKEYLESEKKHDELEANERKRKEYNKDRTHKLLRRIDKACSHTIESLDPFRGVVAWRIIREMGRLKGVIEPNECLNEGLAEGSLATSHWYLPTAYDVRYSPKKRIYSHFDEVLEFYYTVDFLPTKYQEVHEINGEATHVKGMALLPPDIPKDMEDDYSIKDDTRLQIYCHIVHLIAVGLDIHKGSKEIPDLGTFGLYKLTEPESVRDMFPTPQELIDVERSLIEETMDLLQSQTINYTRNHLIHRYGFSKEEVSMLILLTKNQLQNELGSTEEERAFMVLRLQDIAQRAKGQMDLRAELAVMKQIGNLLGLDKDKAQSEEADFIDVIGTIQSERKSLPMN